MQQTGLGGADQGSMRERASFTVAGTTLHLASTCTGSAHDVEFGTSSAGLLELHLGMATAVFARQ